VSSTRRWVLLGVLLLASCQRHQPVFVVNHRDVAVEVVYRNETVYPGDRTVRCELGERKPLLFRGTDVDEFRWPEAVELPARYDESRCEVRVTLPPKSSVVIGVNEFCSGATEYIGKDGFRPRLNYLRVEGDGGVIELSGWEVARNLVERRGFVSHGDCRYELR
jgi:hypothetical protein